MDTSGELPLLMLIEYFYVERPLGSDGFFENILIAVYNILTDVEIVVQISDGIHIKKGAFSREGCKPVPTWSLFGLSGG